MPKGPKAPKGEDKHDEKEQVRADKRMRILPIKRPPPDKCPLLFTMLNYKELKKVSSFQENKCKIEVKSG